MPAPAPAVALPERLPQLGELPDLLRREVGTLNPGGSIYADPADFIDHRACGRQNRAYAAQGVPGRCGSCFTDMIGEAISQARRAYQAQRPRLRAGA